VLQCYLKFVHTKRFLSNGEVRQSDNWQLGIPKEAYAKSMWRHFLDFCLHHRGFGSKARASIKHALCAIIFNAQGYLHEILKSEDSTQ
jgi:hypothetical protein